MSRVLFVNQPSVGHVNTLLSIAVQMQQDGHEVSFLMPGLRLPRTSIAMLDTGSAIPNMVRRHSIRVDLIRPPLPVLWAGAFLAGYTGFREIQAAIDFLPKGLKYYSRRVRNFLERERPDVIVTDFAFPAASLAAEVLGIPYGVIYHSGLPFRGDRVPPFGSGLPIGTSAEAARPYAEKEARALARLDRRINRARQRLGLAPSARDFLRTPYSPWLNLIVSVAAAEVPRTNLTANTLFIGPCFGKRKEHADFPFDALRPDRCKVLVSLGTVFNNRPHFFQKVMRALDTPEYQVILSAGAAYERLRRAPVPASTLLLPSVPQVDLLPRVDLFLSHGGNNSVNEALAAGRPIVVAPVGGEQGDNAARLTYLGVGKRLDIAHADEGAIRAAVDAIRSDPAFARRAGELQKAIGAANGLATASRCVAWLARRREPLVRPEGLPETITPAEWPALLDA